MGAACGCGAKVVEEAKVPMPIGVVSDPVKVENCDEPRPVAEKVEPKEEQLPGMVPSQPAQDSPPAKTDGLAVSGKKSTLPPIGQEPKVQSASAEQPVPQNPPKSENQNPGYSNAREAARVHALQNGVSAPESGNPPKFEDQNPVSPGNTDMRASILQNVTDRAAKDEVAKDESAKDIRANILKNVTDRSQQNGASDDIRASIQANVASRAQADAGADDVRASIQANVASRAQADANATPYSSTQAVDTAQAQGIADATDEMRAMIQAKIAQRADTPEVTGAELIGEITDSVAKRAAAKEATRRDTEPTSVGT